MTNRTMLSDEEFEKVCEIIREKKIDFMNLIMDPLELTVAPQNSITFMLCSTRSVMPGGSRYNMVGYLYKSVKPKSAIIIREKIELGFITHEDIYGDSTSQESEDSSNQDPQKDQSFTPTQDKESEMNKLDNSEQPAKVENAAPDCLPGDNINNDDKAFEKWVSEIKIPESVIEQVKKNKIVYAIDGPNGSGKTTCLEAIGVFLRVQQIETDQPILNLLGSGELGEIFKGDLKRSIRHYSGELGKHLARAACLNVVQNMVPEALTTHNVVGISRWARSYHAYQEVLDGGKHPNKISKEFRKYIEALEEPNLISFYFYCDPADNNIGRIKKRGNPDAHDTLEQNPRSSQLVKKAFDVYHEYLVSREPKQRAPSLRIIDTSVGLLEMKKRAVKTFIHAYFPDNLVGFPVD